MDGENWPIVRIGGTIWNTEGTFLRSRDVGILDGRLGASVWVCAWNIIYKVQEFDCIKTGYH